MQKQKNKKKKRYLVIPFQCLIVSIQLLITLAMLSYTFYTVTDSVSGSDEAYRQSHMQQLAAERVTCSSWPPRGNTEISATIWFSTGITVKNIRITGP